MPVFGNDVIDDVNDGKGGGGGDGVETTFGTEKLLANVGSLRGSFSSSTSSKLNRFISDMFIPPSSADKLGQISSIFEVAILEPNYM